MSSVPRTVLAVALATPLAVATPLATTHASTPHHPDIQVSALTKTPPTDDRTLTPQTRFTMNADGSSGRAPHGEDIPNIDIVRKTIRTYYGATEQGVADKSASPYISEITSTLEKATRALPQQAAQNTAEDKKPAIVLDVDDTMLWTYDMQDAALHFVYHKNIVDWWVKQASYPAVPGMVSFVAKARAAGFTVFALTGRPADQRSATLTNLERAGYSGFTEKTLFTKWGKNPKPAYVTCAADPCTTVEFKAGTRRHIESQGYRIAMSVGDQWSDLQGGSTAGILKLPNPTYYLPSPDLPGKPEPKLRPRTIFTMKADGSSGRHSSGEDIPNIDVVKETIRTYYGATDDGIAGPVASPYRTEMAQLTKKWQDKLSKECRGGATKGGDRPAIVVDTDDTTLMTYDMQDDAMRFHFDSKVQNAWVEQGLFPATPGMVDVVNTAKNAGCTVLGITGRKVNQANWSLANLRRVGYPDFTPGTYITKYLDTPDSPKPPYMKCASKECTTVEFKSSTRAWFESPRGGRYQIIANFGDQYSDLIGGHGAPMKLPNPTYYLP
ncbi:hypothetical protein KEM60_01370 [Austwickia sp. TVS 96-490-7B]|uniref:HAD family acid phosphatase n=1 Tax=Austwickia sp. TVS 96-490-7B TaxID=2830843 RepID=UPI001DE8A7E1|nr:HAD family acid phosphatase [Austwickia sp. TVS 96-490-7B]MBW3085173.1 hypothetical protein [Austwickia sp. TVS 96-490-7B]